MELHTWQYYSEETADHQEWNAKMRTVNQAKIALATEMGVPLVVVNDSHHPRPRTGRTASCSSSSTPAKIPINSTGRARSPTT